MGKETLEQAKEVLATVALLHRYLMRFFEAKPDEEQQAFSEVTRPQFDMMKTLEDRGEATIKELAELLRVSAPSASTMVERLVEMGMLVREHSKVDRRAVHVRLSEAGATNLEAQERQLLAGISEMLGKLGPEMTRQLLEVHAQIRKVISEELNMKSVT